MAVLVLSIVAGTVVAVGLWIASRDTAPLPSRPTNPIDET
jgi:hypothetical protein